MMRKEINKRKSLMMTKRMEREPKTIKSHQKKRKSLVIIKLEMEKIKTKKLVP